MALTKSFIYDRVGAAGDYEIIEVRKTTVIKEDDVIISRSFERYTLDCGTLDASDNFVANPLDKEPDGVTAIPDKVKNVANAVWTTDVQNAWKAKLLALKTNTEIQE